MKVAVKQVSPTPTPGLAARAPGFADLLPGAARQRRALEDRMLGTFSSWGYELAETPAVELLSTLQLGAIPERVRRPFKTSAGYAPAPPRVAERTVPVA